MSEIVASSVQIGDLITLQNDKLKQLKSLDYRENGVLPIVDQGASLICGYTNDLSKRYSKGVPVIVFGDHTLHTKFIDFDFAVGADGTQIIIPSNGSDDIRYLYYLILMATELMGSEGYKRHLKILKEFYIPYIDRPQEQQKIASILTSVDEVIEKTQSQINKLQDLKKGTMNELLTKGIGHTEFKDSPVGKIPVEWEVKKLSVIAFVTDGTHKTPTYTSSGVPFLRVTDLKNKDICSGDNKFISKEEHQQLIKRCNPKIGDILYSKNGTIGVSRVVDWKWEFSVFVSLSLIKLFPKSPVTIEFLDIFLSSQMIKEQIKKRVKQGAVTNLHLEEIRGFDIIISPLQEQQKIASILSSMDSHIEEKQRKLEQTQSLKKSLMQDLLTGKVRVTVN